MHSNADGVPQAGSKGDEFRSQARFIDPEYPSSSSVERVRVIYILVAAVTTNADTEIQCSIRGGNHSATGVASDG